MAKKAAASKGSAEIVAEKSGPGTPEDNKFRKSFTVQANPYSSEEDVTAWEGLHEGNKLATLQEALNRGVHPKGEVQLESTDVHREALNTATIVFTYAVESVAAVLDTDPEGTSTPTKELKGG
jgi:hypothetical protein